MSRAPTSGGIDLSAASALAEALSHLETIRYAQYDGEIQPFTGLIHPRLTVTVKLGANEPDRIMRIGHPAAPGLIYAAEGTAPQRTGLPAPRRVVGRTHPVWANDYHLFPTTSSHPACPSQPR